MAWLERQPQEVCVAIAHRAAMRVLPLATQLEGFPWSETLALASFRACLVSGVMSMPSSQAVGAEHLEEKLYELVTETAKKSLRDNQIDVGNAALSCAHSMVSATRGGHPFTMTAMVNASHAINATAEGPDTKSIDPRSLPWHAASLDKDLAADDFIKASIDFPKEMNDVMQPVYNSLDNALQAGGPWALWSKWYARAMAGDPLPWDLQEQIALIPDGIWQAGPQAVAVRIAEIERQFYGDPEKRPDTVPPLERTVLRDLVRSMLAEPSMNAAFALSTAESIERATREYLNATRENCLPQELAMLEPDQLPQKFRQIAAALEQAPTDSKAVEALEARIDELNGKVARLEADLATALSKSLNGRFKIAAIENLAKTVTSPWIIGALGYGACHFFGWTPSDWTLANLRSYVDALQKAVPKPP